MKKSILFLTTLMWLNSFATHYFVNAVSGNDNNAGTSTGAAWKTLTKVNSFTFVAGDIISFNGGNTFVGQLAITNSGSSGNPITYNSYGTGKAIISGFTTVSAWTNLGSNIWESTSAVSTLSNINMVAINGVNTPMGRYPNSGYFTFQSHSGNTSITDNTLPGTPSWTGAEVVIRTTRFTIERRTITAHSGGTLTFNAVANQPKDGFGYFIQNDPKTLDVQNEWYYNPAAGSKKIRIFSTASPTNVQVAIVADLAVTNNSFITFDGIVFKGANRYGINTSLSGMSGQNIHITNCDFDFMGEDAIYGYPNTHDFNVTNCTFNHSNDCAIFAGASSPNVITGNSVNHSGNFPGMGPVSGAISSFMGIKAQGDLGNISNNRVDTSGYDGIDFDGNGTIVDKNFVNYYCFVMDDGGGIYTTTSQGSGLKTTRNVRHNIVLNGIGAGAGTDTPGDRAAHGIYLDTKSSYLNLIGNSVYNNNLGIFLNNTHDAVFDSNTVYANTKGIMIRQYIDSVAISHLTFTHNISVARDSTQFVLQFETKGTVMISANFVASNNYYCRPISETNTSFRIGTATSANNTGLFAGAMPYTTGWKGFSSQESGSQISPMTITDVNDLRFDYNATSSPVVVSLGSNYIDMRNVLYSGSITLQPFTSAVLIKKTVPGFSQSFDNEISNVNKLKVIVMSNPSRSLFTLSTKSGSTKTLTILITDLSGKIIERKLDVPANQTFTLGNNLHSGVYFVEVTQGLQKEQLKLLKE